MLPTFPPILLRVLTVNTHKGFAFMSSRFVLRELREAVRRVGAQVVFLQEVQGAHSTHAQRVRGWPQAPHYEYLADELWPQFAYGRNAVYPMGHHGNALLSQFPIVEHENRDISVEGHESRGLLHCTLRLPGREQALHAICVHLGLRESHRRRQLELLGEVIRTHVPVDAPLLVAGDFNDWSRKADHMLERSAGLKEVFLQAYGRAARTFPAGWPLFQLDRIYVRNTRHHLPLPLPRQPWSGLSDHAPLAAEISL